MTGHLIIAPILWPFATAVLLLALRRRLRWQRGLSVASLVGLVGLEVVLLARLRGGEVLAYRLGNWPAPFGIALMADLLSGIMLLLAGITALAALWFAWWDVDERRERFFFHPLFHLLLMGINGAFLTGDLFNMFVWYEVLLIASYGLLTLGGEKVQLRAAIPYVAMNLLSSLLFLVSAALLYGVTGTLNLADLAAHVPALNGQARVLAEVAAVLLLTVFGIKAAIFPLFYWLPDAYPTPVAPVATVFAGIMTKVGVYSLLRVFTLVFQGEGLAASLVLPLAGFTMLIGVLGAICQMNLRRLLSFHIISQVGFMLMGIGMFTPLGIAGGIIYIIHHVMVKAGLFLVAGYCERVTGQQDLSGMKGLQEQIPLLAALFFVAGSSLAGVPPLSGFFAKFVVIKAGFEAGHEVVVAVSLVASFLTLFSMMKIWQYAFWRAPGGAVVRQPWALVAPVVLLVSFSVGLAALAGPLYALGLDAARQLGDPQLYIRAVLGEVQP